MGLEQVLESGTLDFGPPLRRVRPIKESQTVKGRDDYTRTSTKPEF